LIKNRKNDRNLGTSIENWMHILKKRENLSLSEYAGKIYE